MNLHLVDDEKFINGAVTLFEAYAPGENIFMVNTAHNKLTYVNLRKEVVLERFSNLKGSGDLKKVIGSHKIVNLYVHFLTPLKAAIANQIKKDLNVKTFWVFYGADLYGMLNTDFGYPLHDEAVHEKVSLLERIRHKASVLKFYWTYQRTPKCATKDFIRELDYFCFWNTLDYELLKKYYSTSAKHIPFIYFNAIDRDVKPVESKDKLKVIVNNSASANGNHATILKKIDQIDTDKCIEKVLVPLSYGSETVRIATMALGQKLFGGRFNPLTDFLDKDTYFSLLDEISVAFYGSRRQEAAGNAFQLLAKGVKVFLRNDNNMIQYLRGKGFIVFSFEDDFNSMESLEPLSLEEMQTNQEAFLRLFSQEEERRIMEEMVQLNNPSDQTNH